MRLQCAFACLLIVACGGPTCPKQLITDPAQALAAQQRNHGEIHSLRAEAKIDQRSRDGRIKGKVLMFVERPNRVRFDAMTQFGPALVFTSDGSLFALSDLKDNHFYSGPACRRNVARMIGVALSAQEVVNVLLGGAAHEGQPAKAIRCSGEGGYTLTRDVADGLREEVTLSVHEDDFKLAPQDQRLILRRVSMSDAQGRTLFRVLYDDYREVRKGVRLPFTVHVEDIVNKADALLRFQDIEVDVQVPQGAFTQLPHPGLAVEDIVCQ